MFEEGKLWILMHPTNTLGKALFTPHSALRLLSSCRLRHITNPNEKENEESIFRNLQVYSFHLLEIEFSKKLIIIQLWYLHFTTIFYTACKMTIYSEAAHETLSYLLPTYLPHTTQVRLVPTTYLPTQHRLDWYLLPTYLTQHWLDWYLLTNYLPTQHNTG